MSITIKSVLYKPREMAIKGGQGRNRDLEGIFQGPGTQDQQCLGTG